MSIEKELIPYAEAIALKQLGFDQPCFAYWNVDPSLSKPFLTFIKPFDYEWFIPTPLYSQAFRWFREKYEIDSWIIVSNDIEKSYCYVIMEYDDEYWFDTYEEAELACLRKLIEIVQGGNK